MNTLSTCQQCGQGINKQANAKYCDNCIKKRRKESMKKTKKKYWRRPEIKQRRKEYLEKMHKVIL